MDNAEIVSRWLSTGGLRLLPGALLEQDPPAHRRPIPRDRVEGMLLGLAVGDSLGNTSESMTPEERKWRLGEIRDYLPHPYHGDARGYPSDDTQLAAWTLEHLLEVGRIMPEHLADLFACSSIYGIGRTVRQFLHNHAAGLSWHECGVNSAGNGALMRIAPVLLPHMGRGGKGLWADVVLAAALTHNNRASTSACLAFTALLWELLDMESAPSASWWSTRYVELAADLEGEESLPPRGGAFQTWHGPLWRFVAEKLPVALEGNLSTRAACNQWHSGAFLLETVPSALYILSRHAEDPEEAIVRAVNDTRDNDTIAAIVGAAVGALHGRGCLPARWLDRLSGCTRSEDEGHYQELVEQACCTFVPAT